MSVQRLLRLGLGFLAAACLLVPSTALAANTTCANADFLFPGQVGAYGIGATPASLYFKAQVHARRSYAVMVWAPFQDSGEGGVSLNLNIYNSNTCTTFATGVATLDHEPYLYTVTGHSADHDSIVASAEGQIFIEVENFIASSYTINVMVVETTLFSPWWFTGGTNQAFVLVRNNMSDTTTAQLTFYSSSGAVCGTTSLVVAANGNGAVSVASVGTCASAVSGSASIGFAGTPGGLSANITTIDAVQGTSFDAPFGPRMVWSMMAR